MLKFLEFSAFEWWESPLKKNNNIGFRHPPEEGKERNIERFTRRRFQRA